MLVFYCMGTVGTICKLLCSDMLKVNVDIIFGMTDNYFSLCTSKYIYIYVCVCVCVCICICVKFFSDCRTQSYTHSWNQGSMAYFKTAVKFAMKCLWLTPHSTHEIKDVKSGKCSVLPAMKVQRSGGIAALYL